MRTLFYLDSDNSEQRRTAGTDGNYSPDDFTVDVSFDPTWNGWGYRLVGPDGANWSTGSGYVSEDDATQEGIEGRDRYLRGGDKAINDMIWLHTGARRTAMHHASRKTAGADDWSGGWARKVPDTNPTGGPSTWGTRILPDGTEVRLYRGPRNHVRFYDANGNQFGVEQVNVAQAFAYAESQGWSDPGSVRNRFNPIVSRKTAMPAPADLGISVGDIFYSSWGYDQTNVDFYEVVALTPAGMKVRQVANIITHVGSGQDSVVPDMGNYIGEPMTKRLQVATYRGTPEPYFALNSYSSARLWDGTPRRQTSLGWGH